MNGEKGQKLTLNEFEIRSRERADTYQRYHIDTSETDDRQALPNRYLVKVGKVGLAKFIFSELFQYWGEWDVIVSRPCTYGVFSGPVGGFSPRPKLCVGCLRCTIQHPDFVTVKPNPARDLLGDSYVNNKLIATIDEEARKGSVPVRGQGYRGRFGGPGWDGMFTDMSEIVRPSRDGIHGRELIGTSVDIGSKPMHLSFDENGELTGEVSKMISIQVPFVFDLPASLCTPTVVKIFSQTSQRIDTLTMVPADVCRRLAVRGPQIVPVIPASEASTCAGFGSDIRMIELDSWSADSYAAARSAAPHLIVGVRLDFSQGWQDKLDEMVAAGVGVIHLVSDTHGVGVDGEFVMELLLEAHEKLVKSGTRDRVTLLGTGGIVAADHLPKAIICGLDAVGLDVPMMFALQGRSYGDMSNRDNLAFKMPKKLDVEWGVQRITNISASWRDQLLEILGAMGIREVRRLRGEIGRAMWCEHLEQEAFGDIAGFSGGGL